MKDKGKPSVAKFSQRKQKMMRLSSLTESLIAPALKQRSGYLRQLIAHWPHIVGDYATWAQAADIKMGRSDADKTILILSVHSSRGPEASARSEEFIQLVNRYFGFALIAGIRIKQDLPATFRRPTAGNSPPSYPKAKSEPASQLSGLNPPNEELQQALDALQKALNNKST